MKELSNKELRQLQETELEILIELDRICRKNKIEYSLCGGTLIGAIRHKGFIPWDDDIDVNMLRKDYDKFIKIVNKDLDKKRFYFQCIENDNDYGFPIAKLKRKDSIYAEAMSNRDIDKQNIWIDIFPIDNIKSNNFFGQLYYFKVYALKIILAYKDGFIGSVDTKKKKMFLNIAKILSIFYNRNLLKKRLQKLMRKYNNIDTKYAASFGGVYLGKEIFEKNLLEKNIETKFEGHNFRIPKKYDEYLRHYYGDYMQLPPEEKRIGHHYCEKIEFPKK